MRRIRISSKFGMAMIGLTAIGALALPVSVQGQLLDNFNDGNDDGWTHFVYRWDPTDPNSAVAMWTVDADPNPSEPNDCVYRLWADGTVPSPGGVGSVLDITDDPTYSYSNGYWWATVVRETEDTSIDLMMRGDLEALNAYYFAACPVFGLNIQRIDRGFAEILVYDESIVPDVGREYVLEAGAIGSRIELRMWPLGNPRPATAQLELRDCTHPWGVNIVATQVVRGGILSTTFDDVCFMPVAPTPGDVDGDRDVDLADLARLLAAYDTCDGDPLYDQLADLDCSGCVDLTDLAALLADYGYTP